MELKQAYIRAFGTGKTESLISKRESMISLKTTEKERLLLPIIFWQGSMD